MLSMGTGVLLFALYSVVIILIVYFFRNPHLSSNDFLVMGRKLGVFKGSLSIAVSWIWAPAIFICATQAYQQGLPGIFWFTLPNIITFFVFIPIALKARQQLPEGFSASGIFKHKLRSTRTQQVSLIVTIGYQLGAIIINCVAGATLISLLSGIPYHIGVLMMGGLALTYSLISGLRASVISDVVQMSLILLLAFFIVPWAIIEAGGVSIIYTGIGGHTGEFTNIFDPFVAFTFGIATSIGLISGPIADQMFYQRAFAARKDSITKIFFFGGLIFGIVPIVLSLLGFVGAGLAISMPEFSVSDPQMIGPQVIEFLLPTWLLMLFAVMAFAGLTSTLDSAFSALGSLWAVEVKGSFSESSSSGVRIARKGMLLFAGIGMLIAMLKPQLLWVFLVYGALASSLFFPVIFTLFTNIFTAKSTTVGIVGGILAGTPLSIYANISGNSSLIVASALLGLFIPLLLMTVVKTFTKGESSLQTGDL